MDKLVLIVSNPQDITAACVAEQLRSLGCAVVELWPEQVGAQLQATTAADGQTVVQVATGSRINLDEVDSIWYRRPRPPPFFDVPLTIEGFDFARDEWRSYWHAVHTLLTPRLWVSHPERLRAAASKPLQLRVATEAGLPVPDTVVTNDPHELRSFFRRHQGRVIVKATGSGWLSGEDSDTYIYILTNRLAAHHLIDDDEIVLAPITAQEEVPKSFEVRVNVVGAKVLPIRIDSQCSTVSELDWRRYDTPHTPYSSFLLPSSVASACCRITQRLGLNFGAIDLIRTPAGEYVFLEINGNGQFLWAEQLSGVPVSKALARLLAGLDEPLITEKSFEGKTEEMPR